VFDLRLRSVKDRTLAPIARRLSRRVAPLTLSVAGAVLCIGAGVLAWQQIAPAAVACWLAGRLLDGLDGPVARSRGTASDFGGFADLVLDTVGYAAVPIGLAAGAADVTSWTISAVLLATFYVNAVSLLMLSSVLEKRSTGARQSGESTTVTMPSALIEGTETIVLFTVALAVPQWANAVFVAMAIAVGVGIVQRTMAAHRLLT
jgi:phosphatidylglycerophosphate synthase